MSLLKRFKKNLAAAKPLAKERAIPATRSLKHADQTQAKNKIHYIVAVASGKGGVGKSTVTHQLAKTLSLNGKRVGVLDADVYGPSQATLFNHKALAQIDNGLLQPLETENIKFISMNTVSSHQGAMVVRAPLAIKAIQQFITGVQWGKLDYLLIDLPPGTGNIQLSIAQKFKLSGAVIVTTPQQLAAEIAEKSVSMFQKVNVPVIGIIENMSGYECEHCHRHSHIFERGGGTRLSKNANVNLLAQIPLSRELVGIDTDPLSKPVHAFLVASENIQKWLEKNTCATAIEPISLTLLNNKETLLITWADDSSCSLSAVHLRSACSCALCKDEDSGKQKLNVNSIQKDIKITGARQVGRYAFSIHFSDGHTTGIFSYNKLKEMSQMIKSKGAVR